MARSRASSIIQAGVVVLTLTTTAGPFVATAASPLHGHGHHHHHAHPLKRNVKVVEVPGQPEYAFVMNGELLDQSEVCEGIIAGTLKWADGTENPPGCASKTSTALRPVSSFAPSSTSSSFMVLSIAVADSATQGTTALPSASPPSNSLSTSTSTKALESPSSMIAAVVPTTSLVAFDKEAVRATFVPIAKVSKPVPSTTLPKISPQPPRITSSAAASSLKSRIPTYSTSLNSQAYSLSTSTSAGLATHSLSSSSGTGPAITGLDREFPNGEIDCTDFPSEYGPIYLGWVGLNGWSGIQYPAFRGDEVTDIVTAIPGGKGCIPGAMCSYACPPGYQKSQWPSTQGSTGQSVGGLSCNSNGKLALTNAALSNKLCIAGTGAVLVENKLSTNAAICRTDYPGTENEVVPLNTQPGSINQLTCPDAATYFRWEHSSTSAQYYINNQGVTLQDACVWNKDGSHMGNFAPSCLGVGQDVNGKTWCSILTTADNNPISYMPLNFTVKIAGDVSGNCGLINGRYCSGEEYDDCNNSGCTVELLSGQATYILEDGQ